VARVISPDQATIPPGGEISRRREAELIRVGELRGEKTREAQRRCDRAPNGGRAGERRKEWEGGGRKEGGGQMLEPRHEPRVSDKYWDTVACRASNLLQAPRISSHGYE
jgi:hypothetical protein